MNKEQAHSLIGKYVNKQPLTKEEVKSIQKFLNEQGYSVGYLKKGAKHSGVDGDLQGITSRQIAAYYYNLPPQEKQTISTGTPPPADGVPTPSATNKSGVNTAAVSGPASVSGLASPMTVPNANKSGIDNSLVAGAASASGLDIPMETTQTTPSTLDQALNTLDQQAGISNQAAAETQQGLNTLEQERVQNMMKRDQAASLGALGTQNLLTAYNTIQAIRQKNEGDARMRNLEANAPQFNLPGKDPYLQSRLRQAAVNAEQGLSPSTLGGMYGQGNDTFNRQLQNAATASTGQAGVYGSLGQSAALDRLRGVQQIGMLNEQQKGINRGQYDSVIAQNMAENNNLNEMNMRNFLYNRLPRYNAQLTNATALANAGRQNLSATLAQLPNQVGANIQAFSQFKNQYSSDPKLQLAMMKNQELRKRNF